MLKSNGPNSISKDNLRDEDCLWLINCTTQEYLVNVGQDSHFNSNHNDLNYLEWLDCQPRSFVLYISMGSFLLVSGSQMNEIAAGLCDIDVNSCGLPVVRLVG